MRPSPKIDHRLLIMAAAAAFCTYFCMYAFRKPFTAGTFDGQQVFGLGFKSTAVIAQILGYMLSKFIGIKVVSEARREHRAAAIVMLIVVAELALVGFALLPIPWKILMLFLNGLPLGMIFGFVLAYLEGRRQTEALSAALCASFILSSGVVKSIGSWLVQDWGVSEFVMPMLVGALFFPPLCLSVWLLQRTPLPDAADIVLRADRQAMNHAQRRDFLTAYGPGLLLLVAVYVALSVMRTVRDDFGVEIWRDMGVTEAPSVFARSETWVAIVVTFCSGLVIWISHNLQAIRVTVVGMCGAFGLIILATLMQAAGGLSAMSFMILCGIGLYLPYVAFHTTLFERIIAASKLPGNLGFLMYLADAVGYLGYSAVLIVRSVLPSSEAILPQFRTVLLLGSTASILALIGAAAYFQRVLQDSVERDIAESPSAEPAPHA